MPNIEIKRKTVGGYDSLYPKTIIAQVDGLQTELNAKIPLTQKGAANGVATLDSAGLIPSSQLSSWIRGGIRIAGTIPAINQGGTFDRDTLGEIITHLEAIATNSNGVVQYEELVGWSYVVTQDFTLTLGTLPADTQNGGINPGDEGDSTLPITLEAGDIIIVSNYALISTTRTWYFAVINNTYGLASGSTPGIVTIGQYTDTQDLQSDTGVLTGAELDNLLLGGDLNGVTDNLIARSTHTHGQYLLTSGTAVAASQWATARTITLAGDATGDVSIDGSENVTLTVAVADDSHNHIISNVDGLQTALNGKVDANAAITGATATKITFDAKGLVTAGATLAESDIPDLGTAKITSGTFAIARIPTGTTGTTVALGNHTHTFASLTSKPTTISGYGITDAYTETEVNNLLTNRPQIFYQTDTGIATGDYFYEVL